MKNIANLIILSIVLMMLVACANATPTPAPSESDLSARGFANSPDGRLRMSGNAPVMIAFKPIANPPPAPNG